MQDGLFIAASASRFVSCTDRGSMIAAHASAVGHVSGSLRRARILHHHALRARRHGDGHRACESRDVCRELRAVLLGIILAIRTDTTVHRRPLLQRYKVRGQRHVVESAVPPL